MELSEIVVGGCRYRRSGCRYRRIRLSTWVKMVDDVQVSLTDDMSVCLDEIVQLRHDNAIMEWKLKQHDKEACK